MSKDLTSNENRYILKDKEYALIKLLRKIKYGRAVVILEDGQPIRIERIKESIKL